jgi:hypothetical protein
VFSLSKVGFFHTVLHLNGALDLASFEEVVTMEARAGSLGDSLD